MASESDQVVFDNATTPTDNTALFQQKKWAYITDNSSNGGVFSGQLQFNLQTLANLSQWSDLSQGIINFPVRLQLQNTNATLSADAGVSAMTACVKNGFHQFVDSVQITIGGTTCQSSQIFENVSTTFKILSEWSLEEYRKWGPSLGISFDDYKLAADGAATTYNGIANSAATTIIPSYKGFTLPVGNNDGFKERVHHINNVAATAGSLDTSLTSNVILSNPATLGKGRAQYSVRPTAGANAFTLMTIATVRLKDISDVCAKLPPMKNLKGFIYVNYNAGTYTFTTDKTTATTFKSATPSVNFGHTMPAQLGSFTAAAADVDPVWKFIADVAGTTTDNCTVAHVNARLHVPYYVANPETDKALSFKKSIRYNERFITSFTVDAAQAYTGTLSPGVVNPKRVVLLPLLVGDGSTSTAGSVLSLSTAPEMNPWAHEPAGSSPFACITNLQFIVGGVPMFQTPCDMDYQQFMLELAQQGCEGGLDIQQTSGILDQRRWDQLYRFYTCDIGRRMGSEDGASKSVIVQMTNGTKSKMKVIAMIYYEREIEVDTVMGTITQGL
jgi:hypothetical protein